MCYDCIVCSLCSSPHRRIAKDKANAKKKSKIQAAAKVLLPCIIL